MAHIRNIIDLHCDTLTEFAKREVGFDDKDLSLSPCKLPQDIRLCQLMAVFIPDNFRGEDAENWFDSLYGRFILEMHKHAHKTSRVFDTTKIADALSEKPFAAILSVEGGAVLNGRLENVERLCDLGVRMMTLTWNAENEICGGADTDLGFTEFGREVVAEMERLGMSVDVSHLSDKGFYELCGFASKPFAASHSNSRSVCNHRRNLTDRMFTEIVRRGGVVGLNYYKSFIREDGENGSISNLLSHVHHFLELGGEDTLALGSDFDGADVPDYISGVEKLGFLIDALERSGIPGTVVDKIIFQNAARYFSDIAN